jgi:hypothetical protein
VVHDRPFERDSILTVTVEADDALARSPSEETSDNLASA